jgi:hypothetical protein
VSSAAAGLGCAVWRSLVKVAYGLRGSFGLFGCGGRGEVVAWIRADEAGLARAVVLSWVEEGGDAKACYFLVFSISLP